MDAQYSIKAAAQLADLSVDTLRAWERRYSAVEPRRSGTGRRLYSEEEVVRLSLLKQATDLGNPISMVAPLSNGELQALIEKARPSQNGPTRGSETVDRLISLVLANDFIRFEHVLGQAAVALPPRELIDEVFFPLLQRVGDRWYAGELTIAQEHAVSGNLRNLIGAMIRIFPRRAGNRSIVFATLPGERHEFGILLLSLLAASEGITCHYLGPDLPVEEIARAVFVHHADVVALSIVHRAGGHSGESELRRLHEKVGPYASIWVGGAAAEQLREPLKDLPIVFMANLADFDRHLGRLHTARPHLTEGTSR